MSGLDNVSIDVERLLESVTIIRLPEDESYQLGLSGENLNRSFEICNLKSQEFQSKVNDLSNAKMRIWFDSLQKSRQISKLQVVYATNEDQKAQQNEGNRVLYWYIHKAKHFSVEKFVEFMQQTAKEYEKEFK